MKALMGIRNSDSAEVLTGVISAAHQGSQDLEHTNYYDDTAHLPFGKTPESAAPLFHCYRQAIQIEGYQAHLKCGRSVMDRLIPASFKRQLSIRCGTVPGISPYFSSPPLSNNIPSVISSQCTCKCLVISTHCSSCSRTDRASNKAIDESISLILLINNAEQYSGEPPVHLFQRIMLAGPEYDDKLKDPRILS